MSAPVLEAWPRSRAARCCRVGALLAALAPACGGLAADGDLAVAAEPLTSLDRMLDGLLTDLLQQPEADRRFVRYFLVAAHGGGAVRLSGEPPPTPAERGERIERAAERDRTAVSKLVNSLTLAPDLRQPEPIDAARSILRIDLRHYGWESPTDVAGTSHANRWDAIVARAALTVPLEGPHAEKLEQLTGSTTPFLFARDFVATAATGELYYAMLGLPRSLDELDALMRETSAGAADPVPEGERYRGGFTTSGISPVIRAVERRVDPVEPGRGAWRAFDFGDDERGSAVFSAPLSFAPDATEVIFSLPNGLQGFFVADDQGQRVTEYPPASVTTHASRDRQYESAASCFGCHDLGALGFRDQVRSRYLGNRAEVPADLRAQILATYPNTDDMDRLIADANRAYVGALRQVGQAPDEQDQIAAIASEPRTAAPPLDLAASQLFVSPDQLASTPGVAVDFGSDPLESSFVNLESGPFRDAYPHLLCQLHRAGLNKPVGCR